MANTGTSQALGAAGLEAPGRTSAFAPFEWLLASRYLRARRKEGFISVIAGFSFLGIMLGVATLIIVMAVMNGFRKDLFSKILGLNGHVIVHRVAEAFTDYDDIAARIRQTPGVKGVLPLVEGQVLVSSSVNSSGALVRGISEEGMRALPMVVKGIQFGSIHDFDKQTGVAVGSRMAAQLRVTLGDQITIITPHGATTPFGRAPRTKQYPITAIFELGMSEYDRTIVFMPLPEAQRFFGKPGEVDVLEVIVDDPEKATDYARTIKTLGGEGYQTSDWHQRNETFANVLAVERNVMFIILSLIVLVAALNIISGMMMLVKDKGRDIAILRTMGASSGAMMRVFLITGASIGVVGTIAGLILGVVFCWNIESIRQGVQWVTGRTVLDPNVYYLTKMPADINPTETASIVVMALVLSVLATLYPSWRASKLDPVEALRYE